MGKIIMKIWIAKTLYPFAFWFARWCATNDHEIPAQQDGIYSYTLTAVDKSGKDMRSGDHRISATVK